MFEMSESFIIVLPIAILMFMSIFTYRFIYLKYEETRFLIKSGLMVFYTIHFLLIICYGETGADYYEQIYSSRGYAAFSSKHLLSLSVYNFLHLFSIIIIFVKGRNLPPLVLSLCIMFISIGIVLNGLTLVQYNNLHGYHILNIIVSIGFLKNIIRQERETSLSRQYKNKFLNKMNAIIGKRYFLWAFILLIPVLTIITLILLLFGQESDSMIKVWTETTTWTFSQKEHPPYLEEREGGHYLCTVAACGHPRIVKPLRFGTRRGNTIIVNRQLMIANAYEDMLKRHFGKLHSIIRFVYDKYGYPISKHITNKYASDIIYILMKPFEYFFLINLYLFELKPECAINKQYEYNYLVSHFRSYPYSKFLSV